jgi:hypothetical protein
MGQKKRTPRCRLSVRPAAGEAATLRPFFGAQPLRVGPLGAAVPAASVTAAPRNTPALAEAERRQLTVMFCDLVGSTALSARLDPEDYREVISAYHRAVTESVAGFDGFVANYMGDGALVYFGYPRAHEDDAERAVRAGLGAIDAVRRLDVKSVKLQARVGIATGLVVVGDLIGEAHAGWSANCSSTAISAPSRSRALPRRCRLGRCCGRASSQAGSRPCVDRR